MCVTREADLVGFVVSRLALRAPPSRGRRSASPVINADPASGNALISVLVAVEHERLHEMVAEFLIWEGVQMLSARTAVEAERY